MFKNLKIGTRLVMGFTSVVVLMLVVAFVGISKMSSLNTQVEGLSQNEWPKAKLTRELAVNAYTIDNGIKNAMLTNGQEDVQNQFSRIQKIRQAIREEVDTLSKRIVSAKGKELMRRLSADDKAYVDVSKHLQDLIQAGQADAAKAYLTSNLRPVFDAYLEDLNAINNFQGEKVDAAGEAASQPARAIIVVLLLLVFSSPSPFLCRSSFASGSFTVSCSR